MILLSARAPHSPAQIVLLSTDQGMAKAKSDLKILAFASAEAWETWLAREPRTSTGLWLKLAKKGVETQKLTKQEAIDGALIHGWIDGQLGAFDGDYFLIRFTPRRTRSKWSRLNRERAEKLMADGRLAPAGIAEIEAAKADGRWKAAYLSQRAATIPDDLRQALAASRKAREFFDLLDSANRYAILYRLHDAKSAATRAARLSKYIAMLEAGETIHPRKAKRAESSA
jgi:uncharacterized protein YdeI (YjbR/CyaY-like superfamily)